jgi:hypothetical protein
LARINRPLMAVVEIDTDIEDLTEEEVQQLFGGDHAQPQTRVAIPPPPAARLRRDVHLN